MEASLTGGYRPFLRFRPPHAVEIEYRWIVTSALLLAIAAIAVGLALVNAPRTPAIRDDAVTEFDAGGLTRSVARSVLPVGSEPRIVLRGPAVIRSDRVLVESLLKDLVGYTTGADTNVKILIELIPGAVRIHIGHESALHIVAPFTEKAEEKARLLGGTLKTLVTLPKGIRFVLTLPES